MFLNTEETYKMLQPFLTKDELNMNTKIVRENHKEELYGTVRDVLDVLHRYSIKFPGVCYLAKKQIAEMLNVSTRTIVRACNKLTDLGIIVQYETKRHRGDKRQSTNAIVFLTQTKLNEKLVVAPNVIPECHTKEAPKNAPEREKDLKDINTYAGADVADKQNVTKPLREIEAPKELTAYQQLKNYLTQFVDDKKLAYKMYGIWLAHTKKLINQPSIELLLQAAKVALHKQNNGRIKSLTGYFNGVVNKMVDKHVEDALLNVMDEFEPQHEKFYTPSTVRAVVVGNDIGPDWLFA